MDVVGVNGIANVWEQTMKLDAIRVARSAAVLISAVFGFHAFAAKFSVNPQALQLQKKFARADVLGVESDGLPEVSSRLPLNRRIRCSTFYALKVTGQSSKAERGAFHFVQVDKNQVTNLAYKEAHGARFFSVDAHDLEFGTASELGTENVRILKDGSLIAEIAVFGSTWVRNILGVLNSSSCEDEAWLSEHADELAIQSSANASQSVLGYVYCPSSQGVAFSSTEFLE